MKERLLRPVDEGPDDRRRARAALEHRGRIWALERTLFGLVELARGPRQDPDAPYTARASLDVLERYGLIERDGEGWRIIR